jgi:hypothetical protein
MIRFHTLNRHFCKIRPTFIDRKESGYWTFLSCQKRKTTISKIVSWDIPATDAIPFLVSIGL